MLNNKYHEYKLKILIVTRSIDSNRGYRTNYSDNKPNNSIKTSHTNSEALKETMKVREARKNDAAILISTAKCVLSTAARKPDLVACGAVAGTVCLKAVPKLREMETENIKNDPYMQYMLTEKDEQKRMDAALRYNLPMPPKKTNNNTAARNLTPTIRNNPTPTTNNPIPPISNTTPPTNNSSSNVIGSALATGVTVFISSGFNPLGFVAGLFGGALIGAVHDANNSNASPSVSVNIPIN